MSGKEVAVFSNRRELIEQIRFYLAHDEEREAIREAGYQRTLRDHTYVHRFRAIFRAMGLAPDPGTSEGGAKTAEAG